MSSLVKSESYQKLTSNIPANLQIELDELKKKLESKSQLKDVENVETVRTIDVNQNSKKSDSDSNENESNDNDQTTKKNEELDRQKINKQNDISLQTQISNLDDETKNQI